MKKTILIFLPNQFADWEAAYITTGILTLASDKYRVKTVSLTKDYISSMGGMTVKPDFDIFTAPKEYHALILIGGTTWRNDEVKQVNNLVMQCYKENKLLAGICDASAYLGTLGILNTIKHTSNDLEDLKNWAGSTYTGEENYLFEQAVRDNNVITANGSASLEFAKKILQALEIATDSFIEDWYNFYKLGFYKAPLPRISNARDIEA